MKRIAAFTALFVLAMPCFAGADMDATYHGRLSASEKSFVASIQGDLRKRFPTAADAERAGYIRYTNEDDTGAISYANLHWNSTDPRHPSQLWYDKDGNLLGADFSVPYTKGAPRPKLWGVNPGRWVEFDGHMHYVTRNLKTGQLTYSQYVYPMKAWTSAGGSITNPSATTLVAMHRVKSTRNVVTVFYFPSIWDLIVWVKPNPNGAFADKNPLVKR
jgi:hypothetical protein